jgi:hypothetical protein
MKISNSTRLLALVALGLSTGCATLTTGVDPMARQAGVRGGARVLLYGNKNTIDNLKIYENGSSAPLKVVMVNNPTFKQALGNELRREVAQQAANASGIAQTYTINERYTPAIFLKTKGTHTLRLVRPDGSETTIVAKPHVGKKYVVMDWLLVAPTFFTSLIIDMSTGKWNSYDNIEVNRHFPTAAGQGGTK